jgi:uncharacterized membrane protein YdbT with pleckstrin-like domain
MSYVESHLLKGENLVALGRMHPLAAYGAAIVLGVPGLSILAAVGVSRGLQGVLAVLPVVAVSVVFLVVRGFILIRSTEFAVTTDRIMVKHGVLRQRSIETLLSKVESMTVDQGLLGRLAGYGSLAVVGVGGTKDRVPGIANPFQFRTAMQERIEDQR